MERNTVLLYGLMSITFILLLWGGWYYQMQPIDETQQELSEERGKMTEGKTEKAAFVQGSTVSIVFPTATATARVAATPASRVQGLSESDPLPEDTGLFFVFEEAGKHGIWMKDMRYSIDILWLDADFRVITLTHSASPESFPEVFEPIRPALYVLEVPAGFAEKYQIQEGTQASINKTAE